MRKLILLFSILLAVIQVCGQKSIIDTSALWKWPFVYNLNIGGDGRYATYFIRGIQGDTLFYISTVTGWKAKFPNCSGGEILFDGKHALTKTIDDSLYLITLGSNQKDYIGQVTSYNVLKDILNNEWLIYQERKGDKCLVVRDLNAGRVLFDRGVLKYLFAKESATLLVYMNDKNGIGEKQALYRWNLRTGEKLCIWKGTRAYNYAFDNSGEQISFLVEEGLKYSIWYYRNGMRYAEKRVSDTTAGIDSNLLVQNGPLVFSRDGKTLFFQLIERPHLKFESEMVKVDIWSYKDLNLQEEQLLNMFPKEFKASVVIGGKCVKRLQSEDEQIDMDVKDCNEFVLVTKGGKMPDFWWQTEARSSVYLESIHDGSRSLLKNDIPYAHDWFKSLTFTISPSEKFVVYYDPFENNYFSYSIGTGVTRNITADIPTKWRGHGNGWAIPAFGNPEGIGGWLENDKGIFIYDDFDIWQVDPAGVEKPMNVTNGYGRRHYIRFRLMKEDNNNSRMNISLKRSLLLRAFDTVNKYSGFYCKSLKKKGNPNLLSIGPYTYENPTKAGNADKWVILRQSATEAPNYYITGDFRRFEALSDFHPEKCYNWLTSELVTWTLPDGSRSQGILYKPENFDSQKKYPLIIHYYDERSQELYAFKTPELMRDEVNVPYFASRGYLVFMPDIHYKLGAVGESVVNTLESAARYLSKNSWVDSSRIGVQGHSFGGWETNYLVTHSNLFAAAEASAGSVDLTSIYGSLAAGRSRQLYYEMYHGRIRKSLAERPDLYVINSPIFKADRMNTPLLMMYNKKDDAVPWGQGVEFFTALRRLGKKVWMLQYDNGTHGLINEEDAMDYTIRVSQFFDHYLKGQAAPRWMIEGIPAENKGRTFGYELVK